MLTIVWQIICQKVNSLIFSALGYKPYLGLIGCRNCLSCPIRVSICLSRHIMSRWHRPSLAREHHIFHALTGGGSRRRQTSPWVGAAWEWDGLHWNYPSWLVDFVFLLLARHNPSELGILLLLRSSVGFAFCPWTTRRAKAMPWRWAMQIAFGLIGSISWQQST